MKRTTALCAALALSSATCFAQSKLPPLTPDGPSTYFLSVIETARSYTALPGGPQLPGDGISISIGVPELTMVGCFVLANTYEARHSAESVIVTAECVDNGAQTNGQQLYHAASVVRNGAGAMQPPGLVPGPKVYTANACSQLRGLMPQKITVYCD